MAGGFHTTGWLGSKGELLKRKKVRRKDCSNQALKITAVPHILLTRNQFLKPAHTEGEGFSPEKYQRIYKTTTSSHLVFPIICNGRKPFPTQHHRNSSNVDQVMILELCFLIGTICTSSDHLSHLSPSLDFQLNVSQESYLFCP